MIFLFNFLKNIFVVIFQSRILKHLIYMYVFSNFSNDSLKLYYRIQLQQINKILSRLLIWITDCLKTSFNVMIQDNSLSFAIIFSFIIMIQLKSSQSMSSVKFKFYRFRFLILRHARMYVDVTTHVLVYYSVPFNK